MIKQQRHKRILEILEAEGTVEVSSLTTVLPEVSTVTLRRDIVELAEAGALKRTHGGAMLPDRKMLKAQNDQRLLGGSDGELDKLDAVILPPLPGTGGKTLRRFFRLRGIPILADSAPQEGGCYLGPDNFQASFELGQLAAQKAQNTENPKILIVGQPELENTRSRAAGFLAGFEDVFGKNFDRASVNGQGTYKSSLRVVLDAFASGEEFDIGFGVNDQSALALLEAASRGSKEIAG